MTKACSKCGVVKALELFPRDASAAGGRRADCAPCHKAAKKTYYLKNRETIIAKQIARDRKRADEVAAYHAQRHRENAEALCLAAAERKRQKNPNMAPYVPLKVRRLDQAERRRRNSRRNSSRRRAVARNATPAWADPRLVAAYYELADIMTKATGTPYQVDHIEPLRGEHVCGLHNEFNLQVLPAAVNRAKSNRAVEVAGLR